jgi:hypothetical protein
MFTKFLNLIQPSPLTRAFLFSMPDYFTQVFNLNYNIYMTLQNGKECWWQGEATSSSDALNKAWDYALTEPFYKSEPKTWDIEEAV